MPDRIISPEDMELGSGLADDFDGAIKEAWFDLNAEYSAKSGSNDPMLQLAFVSPDIETEITQSYSLGGTAQWESVDHGSRVVSGKNPDNKRWNGNSRAGELVEAMFKVVGGGDRKKGQDFFVKRGFYMTEAGFYAGLNFHWKQQPKTTLGGETRSVLLPAAFLGVSVATPGTPVPATSTPSIPALSTDSDVEMLIAKAEGKSERELKASVLRDPVLNANTALKDRIFRENLIATLVASGRLTVGPDGKYI